MISSSIGDRGGSKLIGRNSVAHFRDHRSGRRNALAPTDLTILRMSSLIEDGADQDHPSI
jgi:hypothetical protein